MKKNFIGCALILFAKLQYIFFGIVPSNKIFCTLFHTYNFKNINVITTVDRLLIIIIIIIVLAIIYFIIMRRLANLFDKKSRNVLYKNPTQCRFAWDSIFNFVICLKRIYQQVLVIFRLFSGQVRTFLLPCRKRLLHSLCILPERQF
mgnify:CR=1 FL=1